MKIPKIVCYQYVLKARREEDSLTWGDSIDLINDLFLGFPWQQALDAYNKRAKFYFGFSISGHGDELFPVVDAKVELSKASLGNPEFLLEVACMPNKLELQHHSLFQKLLDNEELVAKDEFKIWWDSDPRGPRKRKLKDKKKLISQIKEMPTYDKGDDLKMEDAEVSLFEALTFFGFETTISAKDARAELKPKYRKLQLQHHPDAETGNQENFLYLEKCHSILTKWTR